MLGGEDQVGRGRKKGKSEAIQGAIQGETAKIKGHLTDSMET